MNQEEQGYLFLHQSAEELEEVLNALSATLVQLDMAQDKIRHVQTCKTPSYLQLEQLNGIIESSKDSLAFGVNEAGKQLDRFKKDLLKQELLKDELLEGDK